MNHRSPPSRHQQYNADLAGMLMDWEAGELSSHQTIHLFSRLAKEGLLDDLQGTYGRNFHRLVDAGYLTPTGEITSKGGHT